MNAVSPVLPNSADLETVFGKDQTEYDPLPAFIMPGTTRAVLTRWRLTDEERNAIASGADIVLTVLTFHQPLQPLHLQVALPDEMPVLLE